MHMKFSMALSPLGRAAFYMRQKEEGNTDPGPIALSSCAFPPPCDRVHAKGVVLSEKVLLPSECLLIVPFLGPFSRTLPPLKVRRNVGSLNGGLANGGLAYLSTIVHDCRHFATKVPLRKRTRRATKVHNCSKLQSGLRPPFESPHLDFPDARHLLRAFSKAFCRSF